jgi:hypothetical protein
MTGKDFVDVVRIQACDGAIEAMLLGLEIPPGRFPSQRDVDLSNWYRSLSPESQNMLQAIVAETARQAVFSFLALLDGVASLGKSRPEGKLQLFYVEREERYLLTDTASEELHNLFNQTPTKSTLIERGLLEPHEVGPASALLRKSVPGDGLEIHHVPRKRVGSANVGGYDPDSAPAIALPKAEHRRMPPE